jgi:hypothetical protein
MKELITTIGVLIIGIITTVLITRAYYRRTLTKSLTPYIHYSCSLLSDDFSDLRGDLKVIYKNQEIDNLYEICFLIENTGDKAIQDIIEPLTLSIPEKCTLLEASFFPGGANPENIKIKISTNKKKVSYVFPLLDRDESFMTRLLLNGTPEEKDFEFSITCAGLPRILKPVSRS